MRLVEELRAPYPIRGTRKVMSDAADEIERLQKLVNSGKPSNLIEGEISRYYEKTNDPERNEAHYGQSAWFNYRELSKRPDGLINRSR